MTWNPPSQTPSKPGWYLVQEYASGRPQTIWWSRLSTQWRDGARLVKVTGWSGPIELPEQMEGAW